MKQFNKFLALALVAGVFSANVFPADGSMGVFSGSGMSFCFPEHLMATDEQIAELERQDKEAQDAEVQAKTAVEQATARWKMHRQQQLVRQQEQRRRTAARLLGAKKGAIVREFHNQFMLVVGGKAQGVVASAEVDKELARRACALLSREERQRRFAQKRSRSEERVEVAAEKAAVDELIEVVAKFAIALRAQAGTMSAGTEALYNELVKPYDDLAKKAEDVVAELSLNRDAINAEIAALEREVVVPNVVSDPSFMARMRDIAEPYVLHAQGLGSRLLQSPVLLAAIKRVATKRGMFGFGLGAFLTIFGLAVPAAPLVSATGELVLTGLGGFGGALAFGQAPTGVVTPAGMIEVVATTGDAPTIVDSTTVAATVDEDGSLV